MPDNELEGIRVKSAVADKNQLTLYLEDGSIRTVKQGDPRLPALIDQIIPIVSRGEVAVVSLANFSVYAAFEEKTNGLVKFFKVAKKTLGKWFGGHPDEKELVIPHDSNPVVTNTQATGTYVPGVAAKAPVANQQGNKPVPIPKESQRDDELSQPAPKASTGTKVAAPTPMPTGMVPMTDENHADNETVVAVIDGMIIPEMEKVKPYLTHAIKHNGQDAVVAFLRRLIPMLSRRQHSIQDLLKFMQAGDLPIAQDGSIIAYKILKKSKSGSMYVDCHTGRVPQSIGSYVTVDEKLVDLDRKNECSNGLHVARRAYIGQFNGDVITLIKVAPEDVITVPHRDANKVRTKGYHILAELSQEAYNLLRSNKSATREGDTSEILAKIIRGDHVAKLERVEITQQNGNGIVVTQLEKAKKITGDVTEAEKEKAQSIDAETAAVVNPKLINQKVNEEIKKVEAEKAKPTRKLDIETKPDIQKFIATFGGSYDLANFVKDHVSKGGDPHRALASHAIGEFRVFANTHAKEVFNQQAKEIFKDVAPKPKRAPKPVAKKKPEPAPVKTKTKAEPKPKADASTPVAQSKTKPAPEKSKAKPSVTKPANETKPSAKKGFTKVGEFDNTKPVNKVKAKTAVPVASEASSPVKSSEKKTATAVSDKPVDKVAEVLKLYDEGKGTTEISKLTGVPRGTLAGWIKKNRTKPVG